MRKLKQFLTEHGLRQRQLAEAIGVSETCVSKWFCRGNAPTKENIDATLDFCREFDPSVTYEDLFGSEAA